jgi:hypothetical protein
MPAHLHAGPACSGHVGQPCNPSSGCGCKNCLSGGALLLCQQTTDGRFFCFHSEYYLGDDVLSDAETQRIQASLKSAQPIGARNVAPAPPPAVNDPLGNVIKVFASRQGNGVFPKIPRQQLAKDLLVRARDPSVINQGPTYMCGPAAFMYSLARDNPVRFILFVADLYEHGYARMGDLEVRPSERFRNEPVTRGTPAADWVALGGLRDSENYLFSYHSGFFEHQAGGTTASSVASWFTRAGYSDVQDYTMSHGQMMNAHLANDYLNRGYRVCLLIDGDLLGDDDTQRSTSIVPNHFVILTSPILEDDTGVKFTVYTWRSEKREVPMKMAGKPAGRVPIPVFLSKYYGFIAGKP